MSHVPAPVTRVAIRVDASPRLGRGHLSRCLALAEALRTQGADVSFISRQLPGDAYSNATAEGFRVHRLPSLADRGVQSSLPDLEPGSLGISSEQDWQECKTAIGPAGIDDWIVVDHYGIDADWEAAAQLNGFRVVAVDDLADRRRSCDMLVNHNASEPGLEKRYERLLPSRARRLLGPRFALLRRDFGSLRASVRKRDGRIRDVLVSFGGSAQSAMLYKALDALQPQLDAGTHVTVVLGSSTIGKEVESRCRELPHITVHVQTTKMAELVNDADLALGAGGVSALERCCLGLPSIVSAVASNQIPGSRELAKRGALLYLGDADAVDVPALQAAVVVCKKNPELMAHVSQCAMRQVDGDGARRIAQAMLTRHISLRLATVGDRDHIYRWRNAEETRRWSLDPRSFSAEEHDRWLVQTLSDPNRILLIGEREGHAIGVLRYDICGNHASVSVYLVPGHYGIGFGLQLLVQGDEWVRKHRPEVREIEALVRSDNLRSLGAFGAAGYVPRSTALRKVISDES